MIKREVWSKTLDDLLSSIREVSGLLDPEVIMENEGRDPTPEETALWESAGDAVRSLYDAHGVLERMGAMEAAKEDWATGEAASTGKVAMTFDQVRDMLEGEPVQVDGSSLCYACAEEDEVSVLLYDEDGRGSDEVRFLREHNKEPWVDGTAIVLRSPSGERYDIRLLRVADIGG